jgi:hypothetical protein
MEAILMAGPSGYREFYNRYSGVSGEAKQHSTYNTGYCSLPIELTSDDEEESPVIPPRLPLRGTADHNTCTHKEQFRPVSVDAFLVTQATLKDNLQRIYLLMIFLLHWNIYRPLLCKL